MARLGDPAANDDAARYSEFLQLFSLHQKWILGHIYHMLHNHHDADDVFQKTSLVLWQKFSDFEPGTDFRAWACQIAFYQTRNFLRTSARDRHRFNDALLELLTEERESEDHELEMRCEALQRCLDQLKEKDQSLVKEVYESDRSIRELAEQLGKAAQTLYNRLNAVRRRLHACIDERLKGGAKV